MKLVITKFFSKLISEKIEQKEEKKMKSPTPK
jgi:hypothetical protein